MTKILFLCVGNSARSQMSEGFARALGNNMIEAYSAGSKPAVRVEPFAIEVMKEKNIDISAQRPKGFEAFKDKEFDYIVSMGCEKARLNGKSFGQVCPFMPGKKYLEWDIPDPKDKSIAEFRAVRNIIEQNVRNLIDSINKGGE
ncbi:MAG: arsenate reductase ArsC [Planctomycetes bacterium]|nr:arsenate reductase ArsC [Planctomycetota bacterium]